MLLLYDARSKASKLLRNSKVKCYLQSTPWDLIPSDHISLVFQYVLL